MSPFSALTPVAIMRPLRRACMRPDFNTSVGFSTQLLNPLIDKGYWPRPRKTLTEERRFLKILAPEIFGRDASAWR